MGDVQWLLNNDTINNLQIKNNDIVTLLILLDYLHDQKESGFFPTNQSSLKTF